MLPPRIRSPFFLCVRAATQQKREGPTATPEMKGESRGGDGGGPFSSRKENNSRHCYYYTIFLEKSRSTCNIFLRYNVSCISSLGLELLFYRDLPLSLSATSRGRGGGGGGRPPVTSMIGIGAGLDKRTVRVLGWKYSLHCIEKCYMLSAIFRKR